MSDYGADSNPDIPRAIDLAQIQRFSPLDKTNVMQWSLGGGRVVLKLANRKDKTNVLFLIQE